MFACRSKHIATMCRYRYADGPCEGTGWTVLHEGARHGGCEYVRGTEICKASNTVVKRDRRYIQCSYVQEKEFSKILLD